MYGNQRGIVKPELNALKIHFLVTFGSYLSFLVIKNNSKCIVRLDFDLKQLEV